MEKGYKGFDFYRKKSIIFTLFILFYVIILNNKSNFKDILCS